MFCALKIMNKFAEVMPGRGTDHLSCVKLFIISADHSTQIRRKAGILISPPNLLNGGMAEW
jgi:hypothetical protein